jgi:soluble lytic murein transglycosylase-like protein
MALVFAAAVCGSAAHADVIEVGGDGTVSVRRGGADVQWVSPNARRSEPGEDVADIPDAAITLSSTPQAPDAWRASLLAAADRYRVSPDLLAALVWQESRWHPAALSPKGAVGLAQLMPATARSLAVDPRDPAANLDAGARYLRQMLDLFDGDVERALAAYNAGPGRVIRAGGIPRIAETQAYVSNILDRLTPTSDTGLSK